MCTDHAVLAWWNASRCVHELVPELSISVCGPHTATAIYIVDARDRRNAVAISREILGYATKNG